MSRYYNLVGGEYMSRLTPERTKVSQKKKESSWFRFYDIYVKNSLPGIRGKESIAVCLIDWHNLTAF